ncbi:MAG TPA: type IVB secretion system protein IcmV [Gammaproteobacteria bacterium]|nr:type IVB secretion system protein IcmV [Gammaproteobacteria bacterium]
MGIISGITNTLKSALGLGQLKSQTADLTKMANDVLSVPKIKKDQDTSETFEEALVRLQLSEADIERRKSQFQRLASIYLILGVVVFLYMVYLIFKKAFFPVIGCLGILLITFSLYFRYSFWLFQMRERRLGCTFFEWLSELTGKKQ